MWVNPSFQVKTFLPKTRFQYSLSLSVRSKKHTLSARTCAKLNYTKLFIEKKNEI